MRVLNTSSAALILALLVYTLCPTASRADRLPAAFVQKRFSINFQDTEVRNVLRMLSEQGGVKFDIDENVKGKVSYSFNDATLEDALEQLVTLSGLIYYEENGIIYIQKDGAAAAPSSSGKTKIHKIKIKQTVAQGVVDKIPKNFFRTGESIIIDDSSNTVVFHGSESSLSKLTEFIEAFDTVPIQVIIEAQIIETSKNFVQDIGLKWDLGAIKADTGAPSSSNLTSKLLLGSVDGKILDVNLTAAESSGEAKVISRPKVVTLNNLPAIINSGVTFNVKTLTNQSTTTPGGTTPGSGTLTGGLQQVTAGLQLNVHPLALGTDFVKLKISVSNSEPDNSLAVDGIPGIVDNSANTSIIVRDGSTAVMAGLMKSSLSHAENRVPWFHKLPVFGWLFRSHSEKDRRTELVILITPKIVTFPEQVAAVTESKPKSASERKPASKVKR